MTHSDEVGSSEAARFLFVISCEGKMTYSNGVGSREATREGKMTYSTEVSSSEATSFRL